MQQKFFLTTPIYYVNARPHIGHAYTTIVADVLARRSRAQGVDTYFLTGTDEHGQKIERSAQAAGIPPQQFADEVSASFSTLWQRMGITHDDFIRTTSARHKRGVQKLFKTLQDNGKIELRSYTGSYCVSDEAFVDFPAGTPCPDCGRPLETVTEQNYFFKLSEYQLPLIDLIESGELSIQPESRRNEVLSFLRGPVGSSTNPGAPRLASETWDLPAQTSSEGAIAYSAQGTPYVPGTLKDLSISRTSFKWGIPVPGEAGQEETGHVIYVWLDALANYMTALGYGSEDDALFQKFWPADLHIVGKEIIRFHCVYWPAFLLAAGLPLPKQVVAHGWLLFEESKMSKSRGNIVRTETILDAFGPLCPPPPMLDTDDRKGTPSGEPQEAHTKAPAPAGLLSYNADDRKGTPSGVPQTLIREKGVGPSGPTKHHQDLFAADVLRYFLLREIPFGQDGSFSFDALTTRYNADLANGYGNLVSRTLGMIEQNFAGVVPNGRVDAKVEREIELCVTANQDGWNNFDFASILENASTIIKIVDTYLTRTTPWKLAKDPSRRSELVDILHTAYTSIAIVTEQLAAVLPYTTKRVREMLGGTKLGPLSPIFPRADKGLAQIMSDMESPKPAVEIECITGPNDPPNAKLADDSSERPANQRPGAPGLASETWVSTAPNAGPRTATLAEPNPGTHVAASAATTTERPGTPHHTEAQASGIFAGSQPSDASPQITIDDFAKVELRVAQVLVCERIPKADKLLRLEVDLGYEKRQILSGIAEWYTPEELIGRRIVVITNLAPRKMRGLESHGMLLAASTEGGKPHLATFTDAETLPLGSRLK